MARRKVKTVYLTPEPKWDQYKDITDGPAQEKAFQDCQYFIRQGSSKLASPISYIFPVGGFRTGLEDFFLDQDLIQKASPAVPKRLRTCICTHKTRSQTIRTRVFTYKIDSFLSSVPPLC